MDLVESSGWSFVHPGWLGGNAGATEDARFSVHETAAGEIAIQRSLCESRVSMEMVPVIRSAYEPFV